MPSRPTSPPPPVVPGRRAARVLLATAVVAVLVAVAACSDPSEPRPVAAPRQDTVAPLARLATEGSVVPVMTAPPGFVPADTRAVLLPFAPSYDTTQPPLPVYGGAVELSGTVLGPEGGVDGATVRLERFVGTRGGYVEVTTNKEGVYHAYGLLGGHYRIRAYLPPDLTTLEPQLAFFPDDRRDAAGRPLDGEPLRQTIDLAVLKRDENHLFAALDRGNPHVGEFALLHAVLVNEEVRKDDGVVEGVGIKDVQIVAGPKDNANWEILESRQTTNEDGAVDFIVLCKAVGKWPMVVASPELSVDVDMPECLPEEPTTTSSTETTATTAPGGSSTSSSSTTTTAPVIPNFAVGSTFLVPYVGPVPAGVYQSKSLFCSTGFDVWVQNHWIGVQINGNKISSSYPMRNFKPLNGLAPCAFTRTS